MADIKKSTSQKIAKASCCGTCDCSSCSCGCQANACRCEQTQLPMWLPQANLWSVSRLCPAHRILVGGVNNPTQRSCRA